MAQVLDGQEGLSYISSLLSTDPKAFKKKNRSADDYYSSDGRIFTFGKALLDSIGPCNNNIYNVCTWNTFGICAKMRANFRANTLQVGVAFQGCSAHDYCPLIITNRLSLEAVEIFGFSLYSSWCEIISRSCSPDKFRYTAGISIFDKLKVFN